MKLFSKPENIVSQAFILNNAKKHLSEYGKTKKNKLEFNINFIIQRSYRTIKYYFNRVFITKLMFWWAKNYLVQP